MGRVGVSYRVGPFGLIVIFFAQAMIWTVIVIYLAVSAVLVLLRVIVKSLWKCYQAWRKRRKLAYAQRHIPAHAQATDNPDAISAAALLQKSDTGYDSASP